MSQFDPRRYARIPLLFLVVLSALGLVLRWQMLQPLPINFRYFVHAHSHTAFMGWVYNALFLLIIQYFIPETQRSRRLFWYFVWLQLGVLGMLFSFPFQGYGPVSIAFSTVHLAAGIAVAVNFFRLTSPDTSLSASFLRWALGYQLLSGIGPLLLGPLAAMGLKETPWYPLAIYFFMHFQFNGWFVLGCLALLFRWLENTGTKIPQKQAGWLRYTLAWTAGPAFLMSALWTEAGPWFYPLAVAVGIVQIAGAWLLLQTIWKPVVRLAASAWVKWCLCIGLISLGVKYVLQLAGSIPGPADWIFANHGLIIAFIHLVFIGVASFMLFSFYGLAGWLNTSRILMNGLVLFFAGFAITEVLLTSLPVLSLLGLILPVPYFVGLAVAAGLMLGGSGVVAFSIQKPR